MTGRPCIGDRPMTSAERVRRLRAKAKASGAPTRDQMLLALGRAVVEISQSHLDVLDVMPVIGRAKDILKKQDFKRRPARDALFRLMGDDAPR